MLVYLKDQVAEITRQREALLKFIATSERLGIAPLSGLAYLASQSPNFQQLALANAIQDYPQYGLLNPPLITPKEKGRTTRILPSELPQLTCQTAA